MTSYGLKQVCRLWTYAQGYNSKLFHYVKRGVQSIKTYPSLFSSLFFPFLSLVFCTFSITYFFLFLLHEPFSPNLLVSYLCFPVISSALFTVLLIFLQVFVPFSPYALNFFHLCCSLLVPTSLGYILSHTFDTHSFSWFSFSYALHLQFLISAAISITKP